MKRGELISRKIIAVHTKTPTITIASEPGVYKLIGRSSQPQAKAFDCWDRHESLQADKALYRVKAEGKDGPQVASYVVITDAAYAVLSPTRPEAQGSARPLLFGGPKSK